MALRAGRAASFAALLLAVAALALTAFAQEAPAPAPAAEHHLHIRSTAGAAITARFANGPGAASAAPRTAADALAALDAAGVERALVLSIAYMFGSPGVEVEDEYAQVRRENDYVAEQVAKAPDRLVGACSVNPLADYAIAEIERCASDRRLSALKLHLANSEVDLDDERHLARLAEVFEALARLELPAVVHLRNDEEYGAAQARAFIDRVLARAPRLPVLIAHMAGWGGYDEATDAAMGAFVDALREGRLDRDAISFDLAAVVFQPEAAGDDKELEHRVRRANQRLAERIREIGVDLVVFGTDWPSWPPVPDETAKIERNARLVRQALPLGDEELARVFANVSPVLGPRSAQ
jgi:predicted TIM-barrel fold metal-dependent hydrolase